ncbi:T9SS type A sorting domain-containing protein [Chryseobacterium sp. RG1]|uniref:T9SS type A sorting domain-containing protein n=1 Tax=Chryseobacterium tagetis TaxID=2801334 RepID=A0ABS8A0B5_9FLAO|nr:T9SS type A sorting domain-containing protein [Chryseobacterium tagetis]MCA6066050.1 T9SS type A sorting domain-containing protein [Chryseobacterium tagetis]
MKYNFIFFLFCFYFGNTLFSQAPAIQWQSFFNGLGTTPLNELYPDIQQTSDGGYILAGDGNGTATVSTTSNFSVIKLNALGNIQWQKEFGGSDTDKAHSVRQTVDGGYIVAGETQSTNGDVTGNHGSSDYWIIKLNSSGNLQWQKTYGGSANDIARSIRQTTDGGYIVAGETSSTNGDVTGNHGSSDYWIIKIDSLGNLQWQKTFGGTADDKAQDIEQTADNGYIIAGFATSNNGNVVGNHGSYDYWIIKLTSTGDIQWQKSFGGSAVDRANCIRKAADGGYFIAGWTTSANGDVTLNNGSSDYWILKITSTGDIQWQKSFGTSFQEEAYGVDDTIDGGCIVTGLRYSVPQEGPSTGTAYPDYWIIKLDVSGNIEWQNTYGGPLSDISTSVQQTSDGGYIVAGFAYNGSFNFDFWIIKLAGSQLSTHENILKSTLSIYPNPAKDFFTIDHLPAESTVNIHDASGRKIFSKKYSESKVSINTSPFINGVYIIQVDDKEKNILSEKLIIRK